MQYFFDTRSLSLSLSLELRNAAASLAVIPAGIVVRMNMFIRTVIPAAIFFGSNQSDNSCL